MILDILRGKGYTAETADKAKSVSNRRIIPPLGKKLPSPRDHRIAGWFDIEGGYVDPLADILAVIIGITSETVPTKKNVLPVCSLCAWQKLVDALLACRYPVGHRRYWTRTSDPYNVSVQTDVGNINSTGMLEEGETLLSVPSSVSPYKPNQPAVSGELESIVRVRPSLPDSIQKAIVAIIAPYFQGMVERKD